MRGSLSFAVLCGLVLAGCAADVGDINRTQPNRIEKSIFEPVKDKDGKLRDRVWYFRPTVTDVPLSAGFAFVGLQGETEKVVWDIQERMLVAYRAYEWTKGSEEYAARPGTKYRGAPVAAFPISGHFDIQRDYNPATGEQTNVIGENTSDRPWYDRKYMRVDWGDNKISDFRFVTAEVKQQAMYYVQPTDPDSKDRPVISADYIDITTKIMVEPETVYFQGYGTFPQCYLWSKVTQDCLGQSIKVRNSFMLAHDDREEFEPLPYDERVFAKFGYFSTRRYVYDRERDLLEARTEQFAERFNLWLQSRTRDANGNLVAIPYLNRTLRPVVYYVNDQFPKKDGGDDVSLIEEAQATQDDWDRTFRETVKALRPEKGEPNRINFLCRNNPVTDDDTNLSGDFDLSQFKDPATGKTSVPFPNEAKDQNKICGPKGLNPQIGDLRYSFQYWVPNPQAASPLGYGPHAADPENGRVISANAFLYGAPLETYATYVADTVSLMVDDVKEEDLVDATYLRSILKERMGKVPDVFRGVEELRKDMDKRGIALKGQRLSRMAETGQLKHDYVTANLESLRKGWASNFLVTDEVIQAFGNGLQPGDPLDAKALATLSPSTWGHPAFLTYDKERIQRLSSNNITAADFYDDSILARAIKMSYQYALKDIADPVERKRARFKAIRRDLMKELYVAVELHEVGHTMGLRHNFAGSSDSLNYVTDGATHLDYMQENLNKDKGSNNYWYVRSRAQQATIAGKEANPLQPAYLYPYDPAMMKRYPMKELQYASIMDYGAKPNGDFFGLGKYDRAAIRFGYGQLVDVFDPAVAGHKNHKLPGDLAENLKAGERHYTVLPYLFANSTDPKDMQKGIDIMVKGRKTIPYADLLALRSKVKALGENDVPVEVPYRFCSDEYVDGSSVCYRFDEGPDMYEMVKNVTEMYDNLYWFNNFKRGRVNFALGGSASSYLNRIYGRYFNVLSNQYKHMVNDELIIRSRQKSQCDSALGDPRKVSHYVSPLCGLDQYASALESLNFFARVLATPDVGDYGYNPETKTYERGYDSTLGPDPQDPKVQRTGVRPKDEVSLKVGKGKFAQSAYDREKYGYSFYYKPVRMGSWWDKYMAIMALGSPYTRFIGVDSGSDVFSYLINFNDLFYSDINNMVGAMAIEKFDSYAPLVDDKGEVLYKKPAGLYQDRTDYSKMKVLDPNEQYTARLIAIYLGIAYFSDEKSDTKFINSVKINVAGMGESPAVPQALKDDPSKYVEIHDPNSHKTYWATRYEYMGAYDAATGRFDENKADPDVVPLGYSILKRVQEKAKTGSDVRSELHYVDIIRGMLHQYEYVRGF
jgi:hypothetical protein